MSGEKHTLIIPFDYSDGMVIFMLYELSDILNECEWITALPQEIQNIIHEKATDDLLNEIERINRLPAGGEEKQLIEIVVNEPS